MSKIRWSLIFLTIIVGFLYGEYVNEEIELCGTTTSPNIVMDLTQEGGLYITSDGVLKVLVVFVRFSDDNESDPDWPLGQPPNGWDQFIDGTTTENSTNYANLTHYFDVMSIGSYQVIGEAIYLELPYPSTDYTNNYGRARANRDALIEIDSQVDFSLYDNWERVANNTHTPQPDGTVDMIFMIWRGGFFSSDWSGEASLGGGLPSITLDGVDIGFGWPMDLE